MKLTKKTSIFFIKFLLTSLIFYIVVSRVSLEEYKHIFSLLTGKILIFSIALTIFQVIILAYRWCYLMHSIAAKKMSIHNGIIGTLFGLFFSQGLPASIGGDAFRVWWTTKQEVTTADSLKVIFFDRIYGLAGLALVCIVSAFFMVMAIGKIAVVQSLIMAVFFTTAALILLLMPKRLGFTQYCLKISQRLPLRLRKVIFWIDQLRESISQQSRLDILLLIGVSIIIHLLVIVQTYLVGHILLPGKINLFICFLAVPPALLVSYLPISIAGWGVREASMVVAFGIFGVSAPIAIIISLFVGLTVLLVSCVGGLLWLLGWRSDKKELCTNDI